MQLNLLNGQPNTVSLNENSKLRRKPRFGWRKREDSYLAAFEDRILFYDCFWDHTGEKILLVGPPALNLWDTLRKAQFICTRSGTTLVPKFHQTLSTLIVELDAQHKEITNLTIKLDAKPDNVLTVNIGENLSQILAGVRAIFAMSKNNDLIWIESWAKYYVARHKADTVVLFDNGSTKYNTKDIQDQLSKLDGLKNIIIVSWPFKFGAFDQSVIFNPYSSHFAQICCMSVMLRRFGMKAEGIVNCDIDELVHVPYGTTIFEKASASQIGLVSFEGKWVEAALNDSSNTTAEHSHFHYVSNDPINVRCKARKWVLQPTRNWVNNLRVHPNWHWIENRPRSGIEKYTKDIFFWHFKGINTNWKLKRASIEKIDPKTMNAPEELKKDLTFIKNI